MALPRDYSGQACSVARALEIIGERWTLLIIRDAFWGVRRFGDFALHLEIPRAVLAARLKALVAEGVMEQVPGTGSHAEYALTDKGQRLWPVLRELMTWGDEYYSPGGPRRILRHVADDGRLDAEGRCETCGETVPAPETVIVGGPGLEPRARSEEPVLSAFAGQPRHLLQPIRG